MDPWSIALMAVAGYVAVTSLVRLMARRRDQLLHDFREQIEAEKGRKAGRKGSNQYGGPSKAA